MSRLVSFTLSQEPAMLGQIQQARVPYDPATDHVPRLELVQCGDDNPALTVWIESAADVIVHRYFVVLNASQAHFAAATARGARLVAVAEMRHEPRPPGRESPRQMPERDRVIMVYSVDVKEDEWPRIEVLQREARANQSASSQPSASASPSDDCSPVARVGDVVQVGGSEPLALAVPMSHMLGKTWEVFGPWPHEWRPWENKESAPDPTVWSAIRLAQHASIATDLRCPSK